MMYDYRQTTALVTGASSGIGETLARSLARRGVGGLVLVARSADKLTRLAEELQEKHGLPVAVIPADLSDPETPQRLKEETDRRGLTVDLLVNNAGFGSYGPFEALAPAREDDMVSVNVAAVVALTRAYLPDMAARGRGGILNVASTAGFQPVPYMATYGATKAFVLSFTEALWAEMRSRGVRVCCLCPGGTATEFGANVGTDRGRFENFPAGTAEEVAEAGLDGWERNASFVIVGRANYALTFLTRFAPRAAVAGLAAAVFRPGDTPRPGRPKAALGIALGLLAGAVVFRSFRRPSR